MKIKITSDSTCDLPITLLKEYDIEMLPLYVIKKGVLFKDGITISPNDIFNYFENEGELCSTSSINLIDYSNAFKRILKTYDAIIHICIGSNFSSCYQNATLAAQEFKNVFIIDSQNLCAGQGLLVLEAAKLSKKGFGPREIVAKIESLVDKVDSSFVLDTLAYMQKGGRCSSVEAFGANLLGLKICLEVKNGKLEVSKKYRGQMDKVITKYIKDKLSENNINKDSIFLANSYANKNTLDIARKTIKDNYNFEKILETIAGCTISCHCGRNTIGIFFLRN